MICPNCGNEIPSSNRFCPHCGCQINGSQWGAPPPPSPCVPGPQDFASDSGVPKAPAMPPVCNSMPGPVDFKPITNPAKDPIQSSWSLEDSAIDRNKVEKKNTFLVLFSAAVVAVLVYLLGIFHTPMYSWFLAKASHFWDSRSDYVSGQISVTFITVSVLSMLSDNSKYIYWENVIEKKLINPVFSCYKSYTIYSFVAMFGSIISLFTENSIAFTLFFIINIGIIFLLTINMIDIYYNTNRKKIELQARFEKNFQKDFNKQKLTMTLDRLFCATAQAYDNHDYDTVSDNLDFMLQYAPFMNASILQNIMRFADEIYSVKIGLIHAEYINKHQKLPKSYAVYSYMSYQQKRAVDWLSTKDYLDADVLNHAVRDTFFYNLSTPELIHMLEDLSKDSKKDVLRIIQNLQDYIVPLQKDVAFESAWGAEGVYKLKNLHTGLEKLKNRLARPEEPFIPPIPPSTPIPPIPPAWF